MVNPKLILCVYREAVMHIRYKKTTKKGFSVYLNYADEL